MIVPRFRPALVFASRMNRENFHLARLLTKAVHARIRQTAKLNGRRMFCALRYP